MFIGFKKKKMAYGFTSINTAGRVQIDGLTRNNRVLASGTAVGVSGGNTLYYPSIGVYPLVYVSIYGSAYLLEIQQTYARINASQGVTFDWVAVAPEFSTSFSSNTYGIVVLGEPTGDRPINVLFSSDRENQPVIVGSLKVQMNQNSSIVSTYDFNIPNPTLYKTYVLINALPYIVNTKTGGTVAVSVSRPSTSVYQVRVGGMFPSGFTNVRYSADVNIVIPFVRLI